MTITFASLTPTKNQSNNCKGRIYRYQTNHFSNSRGDLVWTDRMVLQKRLSCPGCKNCGWIDDDRQMNITCGSYVLPVDLEKGQLYALNFVITSIDTETGHLEDYELHFKPIEE